MPIKTVNGTTLYATQTTPIFFKYSTTDRAYVANNTTQYFADASNRLWRFVPNTGVLEYQTRGASAWTNSNDYISYSSVPWKLRVDEQLNANLLGTELILFGILLLLCVKVVLWKA